MDQKRPNKEATGPKIIHFGPIKGSSDPSLFIFEINVGKRRIRHSLCHIVYGSMSHRTTPNLNEVNFQNYFKKMLFQIQSRSTSDPTLSDIDFKNEMTWV